jgi:hypothetical protein
MKLARSHFAIDSPLAGFMVELGRSNSLGNDFDAALRPGYSLVAFLLSAWLFTWGQ